MHIFQSILLEIKVIFGIKLEFLPQLFSNLREEANIIYLNSEIPNNHHIPFFCFILHSNHSWSYFQLTGEMFCSLSAFCQFLSDKFNLEMKYYKIFNVCLSK